MNLYSYIMENKYIYIYILYYKFMFTHIIGFPKVLFLIDYKVLVLV